MHDGQLGVAKEVSASPDTVEHLRDKTQVSLVLGHERGETERRTLDPRAFVLFAWAYMSTSTGVFIAIYTHTYTSAQNTRRLSYTEE